MCGIVGILGKEPVAERLIESLKRLEYRGYDSAGIGLLDEDGIDRVRAPGKLKELVVEINGTAYPHTVGMGHTRWATHGAPTRDNAHPHLAGGVMIVHNGIIENFKPLKDELISTGAVFATETDTEVVAHLLDREIKAGKAPQTAVSDTLAKLEGAYAFVVLFKGHTDIMIGARRGSPLAVGHGDGEMYLGSDAMALAPYTNRVSYLDDGDMVVLRHDSLIITDETGAQVDRPINHTQASALMAEKGPYKHFMAKELAEQPDVVGQTLAEYIDFANKSVKMPQSVDVDFAALERMTIIACGTASYAGMVAKYWIERLARIPVEVDIASEFRYREAPLPRNGFTLAISQSGETLDTLAALRYAKTQGQTTVALVNVPESTIERESTCSMRTYAGPEIGVASTKAFTCQLAVLACLAIAIARAKGKLDPAREAELVSGLIEVPRRMVETLKLEDHIGTIAQDMRHARDVLYLGRGIHFPVALEGALKLKELSYIHAEGYAAGELKHGPIALVEDDLPVVVIAPDDELYDKTISNMLEVAARGARIILITDKADAEVPGDEEFDRIIVPGAHPFVSPLLFAIPVQQLAYHTAVALGTDVDQPRNLAKSVTVE